MMKVINANPGMGASMTEEEAKDFMANNSKKLLIHIATVDQKGEPNVTLLVIILTKTLTKSILQRRRVLRKFII
jgi:hypothetical protein